MSRAASAGALLLLLAVLGACGTGAPAPPARPAAPPPEPFAPAERDYLVDPLTGYPGGVDPERAERLRQAHRTLLAASDVRAAVSTAADLLTTAPGFAPAHVLASQVEHGEAQHGRVIERLLPVVRDLPEYVAAQLLLGRAAELSGDIPLAYSAFRRIATQSPLAFQRLGDLHPRAVEIVANRLGEALRQGRLAEGEEHLERLRSWAPTEERTWEGARAVALARGDRVAELAAVQELAELAPDRRELLERQAELELAVGDPGAGLQIIQGLAAREPDDPVLAEKLAAAKFRWRLSMLPREVQEVASRDELSRGDYAVLLYWLVPGVRYGRPTTGRIATDILEHPHQEEIVRVVNLGLLDVDATLHRFSPAAPVRRSTAQRSLVLLMSRFQDGGVACLGGAAQGSPSQAEVCEAAKSCGLVPPEDECRTGGGLSGGEAVDLIRRTLMHLGGS